MAQPPKCACGLRLRNGVCSAPIPCPPKRRQREMSVERRLRLRTKRAEGIDKGGMPTPAEINAACAKYMAKRGGK